MLGLPGNPVSALVCAHVFLLPMMARMLGLAADARPNPEAVLGEAIEANGAREHYMRAVSAWRETGERVVRPLPSQDSSLVAALARADCLIVRTPHALALPEGARVRIIPLETRLRRRKPKSREVGCLGAPTASRGIHACGTQTEQIKCS